MEGPGHSRAVRGRVSNLETRFAALVGRQMGDDDKQALYQIKDELGIAPNDALWDVLIALHVHRVLLEEIPARIGAAARGALGDVRAAADDEIAAATQSAKADLAAAVATTARDVARDVVVTDRLKWTATTIAVTCLVLGGLAWRMHAVGLEAGEQRGYVSGYEAAKDEKAAASWAATAQGRAAVKLARNGTLQTLLECSRPGWERTKKGACIPYRAPDEKVYGWLLP